MTILRGLRRSNSPQTCPVWVPQTCRTSPHKALQLGNPAACSAATRTRPPGRMPTVCPHGRRRSQCRECGGGSMCPHGRQRSVCRDCGGGSICEHRRVRSKCKDCMGSQTCEHGLSRVSCDQCQGAVFKLQRKSSSRGRKREEDAYISVKAAQHMELAPPTVLDSKRSIADIYAAALAHQAQQQHERPANGFATAGERTRCS